MVVVELTLILIPNVDRELGLTTEFTHGELDVYQVEGGPDSPEVPNNHTFPESFTPKLQACTLLLPFLSIQIAFLKVQGWLHARDLVRFELAAIFDNLRVHVLVKTLEIFLGNLNNLASKEDVVALN